MNLAASQWALIARGYDLGTGGPSGRGDDGVMGRRTRAAFELFQAAAGLPVTGEPDAATLAKLAPASPPIVIVIGGGGAGGSGGGRKAVVDPAWMPDASMSRIVVHWTAGAHKASELDRGHYHVLIEGDGGLVRGRPSIRANQAPPAVGYAAHTLNCNSGSIGVSLCAMAGAIEAPFSAGPSPLTRAQWDRLPEVLADLCRRYHIPVTPQTVLSHAEVQDTLGIKQRGKWDISRLPFDPSVIGARAVGDLFRARTAALLAG